LSSVGSVSLLASWFRGGFGMVPFVLAAATHFRTDSPVAPMVSAA
jgi:hypothetical protein